MQIRIDIPEKVNNRLRSFLGHGYALRNEDVKIIAEAIYNGQTEPKEFEWCRNCKEYDSEKHCCPRFNRVIRKTLEEAQTEIIRCKDCKHWGHKGLCNIWDEYISNEDFYCGCAER